MLLPEYTASVDPREIQEKSEAATAKAISLDPNLPEVLASMGWNRLIHHYDCASISIRPGRRPGIVD